MKGSISQCCTVSRVVLYCIFALSLMLLQDVAVLLLSACFGGLPWKTQSALVEYNKLSTKSPSKFNTVKDHEDDRRVREEGKYCINCIFSNTKTLVRVRTKLLWRNPYCSNSTTSESPCRRSTSVSDGRDRLHKHSLTLGWWQIHYSQPRVYGSRYKVNNSSQCSFTQWPNRTDSVRGFLKGCLCVRQLV